MSLIMRKDMVETLPEVDRLYIGVGWKTTGGGSKGIVGWAKRQKGTDLDVWAAAFDLDNEATGFCWFDDRDPFDNGSLLVSDDNTSGKGPGDDEFLTARLSEVPRDVKDIVFGVSAYKEGVTFSSVSTVACRIVNQGANNLELGSFRLPVDSISNAVVLCKVSRPDPAAAWTYTTLKKMGNGKSKLQLINLARG